ncbi:MAG: diaminopimelate epimerase [Thermodesulfobacteriota bacterium]|nr:diaminopimelate epimerase [Thermodesulfobacteriota bacterium]MEE2975461.1 diaminopimelate epimerase [Thermodesulfobacteriota bacterium]|tara:strand:- start:900 stop:1730 length:831 start_codon:yes stop_codon:yes gene_type:complete
MNSFVKSHGLGNDYIVIDKKKITFNLNIGTIQKICNRNYGIGSDGLLVLVESKRADFGLRIFNPDGSEAEKSGNGLRIFSKFLYDYRYTKKTSFTIETKGGVVKSELKNTNLVRVEMGNASFEPKTIPYKAKKISSTGEKIKIRNKNFVFTPVTVGNPHCVVFRNSLNAKELKEFGSILENNKKFPNKTNVQFAKVISRNRVKIEIWERGAGYTLASGSSSCAVVAVGYKMGLLNKRVKVEMPGGNLIIEIDKNFNLIMEGPVEEVCTGKITFTKS